MNASNPATTRLVPADRLAAVTSLIAEGAVFDGNFHTARDQGIKVDGILPKFDPHKSEWENMKDNGFDRIWDCGHLKYLWKQRTP